MGARGIHALAVHPGGIQTKSGARHMTEQMVERPDGAQITPSRQRICGGRTISPRRGKPVAGRARPPPSWKARAGSIARLPCSPAVDDEMPIRRGGAPTRSTRKRPERPVDAERTADRRAISALAPDAKFREIPQQAQATSLRLGRRPA